MRIEGLSADTFWKGEVRVSGLVTDGKEQHKARIYVKGSQVYDYSCSCVDVYKRQTTGVPVRW